MLPTRRDALALAGEVAAGALVARAVRAAAPPPDLALTLRARPAEVDLGGGPTAVWRYEAADVRGPAGSVTQDPASFLGPTLRVRRGQRVRVRFENGLPQPSIIHWHGLDLSDRNDGHPRLAIDSGESYDYEFPVLNRAGTYWYHPHPDGHTAEQVYRGLAGLFLVTDDEEAALALPGAEQELILVLQDRALDGQGALVYGGGMGMGMMATGMLGSRVLVQGRAPAPLTVGAGSYRLRLVNGSNARTYKLAWSDGSPVVVIGSDGGLLRAPLRLPYLMLSPGERAEVWADFGRLAQGDSLQLQSRSFDGGGGMGMMMGMGMGRMGRMPEAPAQGAALTVCRFEVRGRASRRALPVRLAEGPPPLRGDVEGPPARRFGISMAMMAGWRLNGRSFELEAVAPNERVRLGATEDWEFWNPEGMMAMAHPLHIHGPQFQVVRRSLSPTAIHAAATVREGLVDQGWKDTFLIMPGERVRVRVHFGRYPGLFLYHCHILEHEDAGMMRNFAVES